MAPPDIPDLVVRSRRVVTPEALGPAAILIRGGVVGGVTGFDAVPTGCAIFDAGEHVVMPGLVDTHVHINEPGRTEWEGFTSATRAAAAGGVTTLVDMPLNSIPPTTTVSGLQAKLAAATGKLWVDVGFWGGVVPGNTAEIRPLWDAGVSGFKCFLVPSGVEEFPAVKRSDLREALPELVALGAVLLVHSELPEPIEKAEEAARSAKPERYATWLASRPIEAETEAIALLVRLSRELGARIHVVHLSSGEGAALVREAKAEGLAVTAETCPHYLTFSAEEVTSGATELKCAPPVRERENREELWAALREGTIDCVVTDHSPCPPEMKLRETGDFMKAWGGIASLQLSLPAVWTEAQRRGHTIRELAAWMCQGPARLAGLEKRKGAIAVGYDADLVVWDPEASFVVEAARLHHRHKLTPYDGCEMKGVVEATFLRGRKVYERGEFCGTAIGTPLLRGKN
jgi:allantoinase